MNFRSENDVLHFEFFTDLKSTTIEEIHPKVEEIISCPHHANAKAVHLDLRRTVFIDARGIHFLKRVVTRMKQRGCSVIVTANPHVEKIIRLVGMNKMMEMKES